LPLDDNIATSRLPRDEMQRSEVLAVSCRQVEDLADADTLQTVMLYESLTRTT
jgi:hypothetical protein